MDEEGHLFPRNEAVEVCTDTVEKLSKSPYRGLFTVSDPVHGGKDEYSCCEDDNCAIEC